MKRVTALLISSLNTRTENLVQKLMKQNWNVVVSGDQTVHLQNEKDIQNFVEQFQYIDVLIINNQCRRHYRASIEEFPSEKWREIIDSNLITTFTLIKTLWPRMKRQHFGRIIHLANEHSLAPSEYQSACIASHHALIGLNKALSIEGAPVGITSNIIYPGQIQTNNFEDIKTLADLILYLCSDQARSINGQLIPF